MDPAIEKSFDSFRGLLFGLLVNCIFSAGANNCCPLAELRSTLSTEEKYVYVMGLSEKEIKSILLQHKECYERRLAGICAGYNDRS